MLLIATTLHAQNERLLKAMQLNESAIAKMGQKNLDGAESDLLAALAYSNENPSVRKNLSVVYYEKAVREYIQKQEREDRRLEQLNIFR